MIAARDKSPITFDRFIDWYPEASENHHELRRGVIIEMPKPKGQHSEIGGFLLKVLNHAIDQASIACFIPRECIIKISDDTGYEPNVVVLDRQELENESQ